VLIAIGIDWDGRRQILAVDMANRESRSSWKDFLVGLRKRGFVASSSSSPTITPGLRSAVREVLAEAAFQRCYVHFLRNALDHLPRKADDDCLQELRWLGACPWAGQRPNPRDRRSIEETRRDLAAWIAKWSARYQKLVAWAEENIEETLTFYRLPRLLPHLKGAQAFAALRSVIATARKQRKTILQALAADPTTLANAIAA
jgi:putative transposase